MKFSEINVDPKIGEEGGWVSDIPELLGVRLKVRGSNNKDWRRMAQKLVMAVPRQKKTPVLDPVEADKINAILLRECGLLDWSGIEADDDTPVPFSKKKAAEYLESPAFRDGALYACNQVAVGIIDEVEDIAGN
jgi:hypothetical protein